MKRILYGLLVLAAACGTDKQDIKEPTETKAQTEASATAPGIKAHHERRGNRIHVNNIGPLYKVFNDSNYRHYAFAEKIGITPINSLGEAYFTSKPLIHIKS